MPPRETIYHSGEIVEKVITLYPFPYFQNFLFNDEKKYKNEILFAVTTFLLY
jgi:hypothetical protein